MTNKSKKILSEISPGELLDKISILEIKLEKVKDNNSQVEIKKDYEILKKIQDSSIQLNDQIKNQSTNIGTDGVKINSPNSYKVDYVRFYCL